LRKLPYDKAAEAINTVKDVAEVVFNGIYRKWKSFSALQPRSSEGYQRFGQNFDIAFEIW
jgi:hypothetical protein